MRFWLTFISTALLPLTSWAQDVGGFSLRFESSDLAGLQPAPFQEFLSQVEQALPLKLKQTLNRSILIRFEKLDHAGSIEAPPCRVASSEAAPPPSNTRILARVRENPFQDRAQLSEIALNSQFIPVLQQGEREAINYPCGHRNTYRLAVASLVHEMGHLYDFADPKTLDELRFLRKCSAKLSALHKSQARHTDPECRRLKNRLTVSNRPQFLNLMGWTESGLLLQSRSQSNTLVLRSPDPYEFKNWKESFAVNFEYFLLDPEFACRRPAVHRFFENHFKEDPFPNRACQAQTQITLASQQTRAGKAHTANLDPSRIYEIHALFAGQGPQLMSKWGHSLYRLVICAPHRKQPGPECLNDIPHHVTISFRASVSDSSISYWKGLKGDYPSLIVAEPLTSIIEQYNKTEFRELTSLPLQLSRSEKELFIFRVLEAYWEYAGRYKFITNNCATEALHFLKGVLPDKKLASLKIITPLGLHSNLKELNLVDTSVLDDLTAATEKGYYYPSKKPELDRAFQGLSLSMRLEEYLKSTQAEWRRLTFEKLVRSQPVQRKIFAARFFILESAIQRKIDKDFNQTLSGVLETGRWDGLSTKIQSALSRIREIQKESLPFQTRSSGYGIPTALELENSNAGQLSEKLLSEQKVLLGEVLEWSKEAFKEWHQEIEAIQTNRLFFLREMRHVQASESTVQ